ncbi:hypothetical protein [Pseudonocardia sediminis]|uniref:hypothetical protein n=1 Tax=Pseudonocardia sediminis TaxID=1397368 RepID=UPI0013EF2C44|nr:hypothetical protein [Pseudonocardia sediminis]
MLSGALADRLRDSDPALRWAGEPSKWLTLSGTRVLDWSNSRAPASRSRVKAAAVPSRHR